MKRCPQCEIDKDLSEFSIDRSRSNGHTSWCKQCVNAYRARYAKENVEKIEAYRVKYKIENADKIKARQIKQRDEQAKRSKIHREGGDPEQVADSKWCRGCRIKLPSSAYARNHKNKSGLEGKCKDCHALYLASSQKPNNDDRACTRCRIVLPVTEFYPDNRRVCGRQAQCKKCQYAQRKANDTDRKQYWKDPEKSRAYASAWQRANYTTEKGYANYKKDRAKNPQRDREGSLRSNYDMSLADWDRMFDDQSGRCAICHTDRPGGAGNVLHVDHSHTTGKVRGLLCTRCNTSLGGFGDSIASLLAAIEYLERTDG